MISRITAVERSSRRCDVIAGIASAVSTPTIAKTASNSINENPRLELKVFGFVSGIIPKWLVIPDDSRYRGEVVRETPALKLYRKRHTETARQPDTERLQPNKGPQ